jgi:phospholipase C
VSYSLKVTNRYDQNATHIYSVAPGASVDDHWLLTPASGWYDLSVTAVEMPEYLRRFAGHIETGRPSISDQVSSKVDEKLSRAA